MAWYAKVAADIAITDDGQYSVLIHFYDDAAPNVILWSKSWALPIDATVEELQAAVIQEGQKARAWVQARDGARLAVPFGATVAIP